MAKELNKLIKESIKQVQEMTDEQREAMYAEQCKVHNPYTSTTDGDILLQLALVNEKLNSQLTWGGAVTALIEWKQDLEREIRRRGLTLP